MHMDIKKEIGKAIRKHRLRAGLTQMQLADKVGLTYQQIQKYELGKSNISIERLCQIASALNIAVYALLPEMKDLHKPALLIKDEIEDYGSDTEIRKLVSLLRNLSNKKLIKSLITLLEEVEKLT